MMVDEARALVVAIGLAMAACGPIGGEGAVLANRLDANASGGAAGRGSVDGGGSPSADGETSDAPHRIAPGGYYVEGSGIFTADGAPHRFHGLNRPSLEWN